MEISLREISFKSAKVQVTKGRRNPALTAKILEITKNFFLRILCGQIIFAVWSLATLTTKTANFFPKAGNPAAKF